MIRKVIICLVYCLLGILPVFANEDSSHVEDITVTVRKLSRPGASIEQYLVYTPEKYRRRISRRWPVLFFLHGKGERGYDIDKAKSVGVGDILASNKKLPFILIVPQCKPTAGTWELPSLDSLYKEVLRLYPVDTNRIYLTGLSMGGYGTWNWASANPARFAAIIPISGYGLSRLKPCGMKELPIWTFHNSDDQTIYVGETRKIVRAVKACGSTVINYTESSSGGHDAWSNVYRSKDIFLWMLAKRKP